MGTLQADFRQSQFTPKPRTLDRGLGDLLVRITIQDCRIMQRNSPCTSLFGDLKVSALKVLTGLAIPPLLHWLRLVSNRPRDLVRVVLP